MIKTGNCEHISNLKLRKGEIERLPASQTNTQVPLCILSAFVHLFPRPLAGYPARWGRLTGCQFLDLEKTLKVYKNIG